MSFALVAKNLIETTKVSSPSVEGILSRVVGLTLEAEGIQAPIGSHCDVIGPEGKRIVAEVVGFANDRLTLMAFDQTRGIAPGFRVVCHRGSSNVGVSTEMLGRVLDGLGRPLDGKGEIIAQEFRPVTGTPINPMKRKPIEETLDVGIRAINGLITVGRGQRMGLMAGSGVGKSVLLGMMTRYTEADVVVIGLIGERGREVQEFIRDSLGKEGLKRSIVVATPGDTSPVARLNGALLATTVAEFFKDKGKDVLLLMDSITRVAHAQREIGLAVGEPPATKGYPPSVFTLLPSLIERAGNSSLTNGSITAFYTVLAEGDDQQDPIVDASRAILDGHITLSRKLAAASHFPAIDIEHSVSRLMTQLLSTDQLKTAMDCRKLISVFHENQDLINVGAYQQGSNAELDLAIRKIPAIRQFLQQGIREKVNFGETVKHLGSLVELV